MKVVVIGGVAGGASTAARIRRLDENAEVIMFERGPHVSFSNCSLPFHLSGIVPTTDKLIMMDPQQFKSKYNLEARVSQEVIAINKERQTVTVRFVETDEVYEESYDKLMLSPGAKPILPAVQGIEQRHVFTVRNVVDIERLQRYTQFSAVENIAIIGGGFIGVEVAENLHAANKKISIIQRAPQIMKPYDDDMAQIMHKEIMDANIDLYVNADVAKIATDHIVLGDGQIVKADAVVVAIGVEPETKLAQEANLEIGKTGGIKVDGNYVTSDPAIYAVGDAIEVYHQVLHKPVRLALAGPAQKQARVAADHMYGITNRNRGVIGSSSIRIFNLNCATTGINEKTAKEAGFQADSVYVIAPDKVGLMPSSNALHLKLIFEVPTGKILGAQAIGKGNADKRIDVIAMLITMGGTIEDLKDVELSYSPLFGTAKDVVNMAALVATNISYGRFKQVHVSDVRRLYEENALFVDVREEKEFANGHIKNALNIPLSQLRERMAEIPKDRAVYVHCRSAQRSYNAVMALLNNGYTQVKNVSGSFLGICLYEYFHDQVDKRQPIVTQYNFK
ncbi:FAD-dependent oxidoreductase [Kurthia sibirica]|uniref:Pyridine nucleotide-disulfide oxidoreductase n=1 Tax=Kurthia sibirica TaxID=202750 RepID=A0A2U3AMF9_9BACL|nr:FAD-dependent oxidoreductase [Kurthia sibirica]PWI25705.1 pyridine nucleotide-disulfide oxidoreductase [Kurthia sibirica]GEK33710.1 pyridine nucleotide-disulfide oxidoreductase [Kurthia sibirica]